MVTVFTMAEQADRKAHELERAALVEATRETLSVYAELADEYDRSIARGHDLLDEVDDTLRKVRALLESSP